MKGQKSYSESQIYVDGSIFFKSLSSTVLQLNRDIKVGFGDDLISECWNFIVNFSLSYKTSELREKYQYAIDSKKLLDKIDVEVRLLSSVNLISNSQFLNLSKQIGSLLIQMEGWIKSVENKLKADGSSETRN